MKKLFFLLFILLSTFYSCKNNDDIDLKESEVTLYSGEQYAIKANSDTKILYKSDNEYIAIVSDKGLVTAKTIGETLIQMDNGQDKKTFRVKVNPKYDLYPTPELNFGMSKISLIEKYGTPDETDENTIVYSNYSDVASFVIYKFDDADLLIGSSVMVKTSYSKDIIPFLLERYNYIEEEDIEETFVFIDGLTQETAKTSIVAKIVDSDYWIVGYMPVVLTNE
ncbi:MAG: Ig-like domain-containing protein [Dysgonomonas sp.]